MFTVELSFRVMPQPACQQLLKKDGADQCLNILITYSSVWVVGCVKFFLGCVKAGIYGECQHISTIYFSSALKRR
jgi:hypothetical protein